MIKSFYNFITENVDDVKYIGKLTDKESKWLEIKGRSSYSGGELRPIFYQGKMIGGISWNLGGIDYIQFLPEYKNKGYLKYVVKDNINSDGYVDFITASDELIEKLKNYGRVEYIQNGDITRVYLFEIKDILIKRIPFLKEYNIFKHPRDPKRLEGQRINQNENVKMITDGDIITFKQFNVSSEIYYYEHKVNDNIFHNFGIKNKFHCTKPDDWDELTYRVFLISKRNLEESLSYRKELMVKKDSFISDKELDTIINDMNGILFKIEEFTKKWNIDLF